MKTVESNKSGFSLIEVVLAIGIFLVTILALVGLLGPTLTSVNDVESTDEVISVVNTVNAFLQNSPAIAATGSSKFDTIFNAIAGDADDQITLFVFKTYVSDTNDNIILNVGFREGEVTVGNATSAEIANADFDNAAGTIYRVVLTPSSVIPETGTDFNGNSVDYRQANRGASTNTYALAPADVTTYYEGYFAMEVRIFAEDPGPAFDPASPDLNSTEPYLEQLADLEPLFTYNTAIVR